MSRYVASSSLAHLDLALAREHLAAQITTIRELETQRAKRERADKEQRRIRRNDRHRQRHSTYSTK